jgi:hypothetical protein
MNKFESILDTKCSVCGSTKARVWSKSESLYYCYEDAKLHNISDGIYIHFSTLSLHTYEIDNDGGIYVFGFHYIGGLRFKMDLGDRYQIWHTKSIEAWSGLAQTRNYPSTYYLVRTSLNKKIFQHVVDVEAGKYWQAGLQYLRSYKNALRVQEITEELGYAPTEKK